MRLFSRRQRRRWETEVETVFGGRRCAGARAREFNPRPRARCAQTSFQRAFFFERRNANYRSGMRYDCFCNTVPVTQVQAAGLESRFSVSPTKQKFVLAFPSTVPSIQFILLSILKIQFFPLSFLPYLTLRISNNLNKSLLIL